jgi:hypothetical protein
MQTILVKRGHGPTLQIHLANVTIQVTRPVYQLARSRHESLASGVPTTLSTPSPNLLHYVELVLQYLPSN